MRDSDDMEEENALNDILSPVSIEGSKQHDSDLPSRGTAGLGSSNEYLDFSSVRVGTRGTT